MKYKVKMKFYCEIVKDFNNVYYANLYIDEELITDLPEYVSYSTLRKAIKDKTGVKIPFAKEIKFEKVGRKQYGYFETEV